MQPAMRVHLAVDAVAETVDEAIELGADVLFVHHPLLLRGVTSVATDRYKGCLLYTSPSPRDAHESRMPSSA